MAVSIYVKRSDARAASVAITDLLADKPSERLWGSLINSAGVWTPADDVSAVAAVVARLGELRHPSAAMPVDYGIAKLLRSAHANAVREGRTADAEQLRAIGVSRLEQALPDLVQRAHDDYILPQPGWGSMKMFAIYRGSLDEAFDRQLIEAFRRARLPVFRQLSIIERMEWIQTSPPLAEYLASLPARAGRGEIQLSPAERATAERLRQKLASTLIGGGAAVAGSAAVPAVPAPANSATPPATSTAAGAVPPSAESTPVNPWLMGGVIALGLIAVAFVWARRSRRTARREIDSKPRTKP